MILFSDTGRKEEICTPSLIEKFVDIKPYGDITEKEAHEFWDSLFENTRDIYEATEAQLVTEVYGRSEEEFSFDFDVSDPDVQTALVAFLPDNWGKLSEVEKETIIQEFMKLLGDKLGIEQIPLLVFYDAEPCDCGGFDPEANTICINKANFDDSNEVLNTVAHEIRHAYQYQSAQNPKTYVDLLYAYNFDNYISPYMDEDRYVNFIDYQDQLIEAEARAFANLFRLESGDNE